VDVKNHIAPPVKSKAKVTARLLRNSWFRAAYINMAPGEIFMWKRPSE